MSEVQRLRELQAAWTMPLIGGLLDAWDGLPNDLRGDEELAELADYIEQIKQAMEGD